MSARRRIHALALDGGPCCRSTGIDLDVTRDWSAVTCLICSTAVEVVTERWSTPPTPFGWWHPSTPFGWNLPDNLAVPAALIDSYDRWQEATDVAFARAVVAAADADEEIPDPSEFTIERPS